jgi:hypothetical protein
MNPTTNGVHATNPLGEPTRAIVFGYYDGPTEGVIQFGERGPVFRFTMPNEDDQLASENKTREYWLHPMPKDTLERITEVLVPYMPSHWPIWSPKWVFPSPKIEAEVDAKLEGILAEAGAAEWRIATDSGEMFKNYHANRLAIE